jgi:hypothetical protein
MGHSKLGEEGWAWPFQDENAAKLVAMKYEDRKALTAEALAKRKALQDIDDKNPFYHRAAVSCEMADMRCDMAYLILENKRLRELVEPIGWILQRIDILEGAYGHVKMLAESSRIDYGHIAKGLKEIIKLREELKNEIIKASDRPDGYES